MLGFYQSVTIRSGYSRIVLKKLLRLVLHMGFGDPKKLEAEDASDLITSGCWRFEQRLVSFTLNQGEMESKFHELPFFSGGNNNYR